MALIPGGTDIQNETRAELIRRITQPGSRKAARSRQDKQITTENRVIDDTISPKPGFRIRTATTTEQMEAQISRLSSLIANDNIDMSAPAGSYINFLL
ncbi:MAG: hypothetical protein CMM58_10080 [Rhodospirillaceae bacterium]|nr:hypothetical protein [Rhodospirillaceae bacterium]